MKINSTSFRPGLVAKYVMCGFFFYGIIKEIVKGDTIAYLIEELNCQEFCEPLNSYKVKHTGKIIRVSTDKLMTRKTYSLWQIHNVNDVDYYISLKYNDE